jgi:uncharacterized protein YbaP (TraB family)
MNKDSCGPAPLREDSQKRNVLYNQAKILIFIMSLLLAGMLPLSAQAAKAEEKSPPHVFLWSVQGSGCRAYILGSIHMLSRGSYPLEPRLERAYSSCRRTVFEADMEEASSEKARQNMLKLGTYPRGKTLRQGISPKTYGLLKEKCDSLGMDVSGFQQLKPWLVSILLASASLKQQGVSPQDGIDAYFLKRARIDEKETIFLETADQQIQLLARTMSGKQEAILRQTLEELDVIRKSSSEMEAAWRRGDAARIEEISSTSLKGYPEIRKKLFAERNASWAAKIDKLLARKDDIFIVVGAAHLVGKDGLLELLSRKGYKPVQE